MNTEILLGKTPDGETVTIEIALRPAQNPGNFRTTDHGEIPEGALELSITGSVYEPRRRNASGGGQCIDTAASVLPGPWTQEDLDRLVAIWRRWHLNGMQAGCVHQTQVVYEDTRYGRRVDLDATTAANDCPEGYRYGSAWLFDALPADVLEDVRRFQRRLGTPKYTR